MSHASRISRALIRLGLTLTFSIRPGLILGDSLDLSQNATQNSLIKGSWSLQFQVTGFFNLHDFQGSTLSAKKHLTDRAAIRFGVAVDQRFRKNESGASATEEKSYTIGLSVQYVRYGRVTSDVPFYIALGPSTSFGQSTQDRNLSEPGLWSKASSVSAGVTCSLGTEWFVQKYLSFMFEYKTVLNCSWSSSHQSGSDEVRRRDVNVFSMPAILGASIYF